MGYYANGRGSITYKKEMNEADEETLRDMFFDVFEGSVEHVWCGNHRKTAVFFYADEKYYEDEVRDILEKAAEFGEIEDGEIEYIGEDDSMWHFVYVNGHWEEEGGHVVYEDSCRKIAMFPKLAKLLKHIKTSADLSITLDPLNLYAIIKECGLTQEDYDECLKEVNSLEPPTNNL